MPNLINVHTHIFSVNHVPQYVVGQDRWWLSPTTSQLASYSDPIVKVFSFFSNLTGRGRQKIDRLTTFARLGLATSQMDQFKALVKYYDGKGYDFRFVVLPMDMEQMGAGTVKSSLKSQLDEIIAIRQSLELANRILPFVAIDPRRPEFVYGEDIVNFVKPYFEKYGFIGIKLYPALGYYPFDPKLFKLYEWGIENNVPFLAHCIQGSIHWQGSMELWPQMMATAEGFFPDPQWVKLSDKDKKKNREVFQRNFTQPQNYRVLVNELKKAGVKNAESLKMCMGHFGMDDATWFSECKQLIQDFPNFYADISYVVAMEALTNQLEEVCNPTGPFVNKVLFGTDYYVVSKAREEDDILKRYAELGLKMSPFADVNAARFLTSKFFSV